MFAFRCFLQFEALETFFLRTKASRGPDMTRPAGPPAWVRDKQTHATAGSWRQLAKALEAFPAQQHRLGALLIGGPTEGRSLVLTTAYEQVTHPPPWAAPRPPSPIQTSSWRSLHTGCSGQRAGASHHLGGAEDMQIQALWRLRDMPAAPPRGPAVLAQEACAGGQGGSHKEPHWEGASREV